MDCSNCFQLKNPYISISFPKFCIIHLIKTIIGIMQECAGFIIIKDTQSTYWEYAKMFSQ